MGFHWAWLGLPSANHMVRSAMSKTMPDRVLPLWPWQQMV